jgi:hypothetical protein
MRRLGILLVPLSRLPPLVPLAALLLRGLDALSAVYIPSPSATGIPKLGLGLEGRRGAGWYRTWRRAAMGGGGQGREMAREAKAARAAARAAGRCRREGRASSRWGWPHSVLLERTGTRG